jgi:hypothetical protein
MNTYFPRTHAVTAVQYLGKPDADGTFAGRPTRHDPFRNQIAVLVPSATLDQAVAAFPGDWIISDSKGNLSVLGNEEFARQYQSASEIDQQQKDSAAALAELTARIDAAEAALQNKEGVQP